MALFKSWGLAVWSLVFIAVAILVQNVRSYRRLSHIPGPRLASFSKIWLFRFLTSGRSHEISLDLYRKYGPLVRIGPDKVLCGDPDEWRRICSPRSPYRRGKFYTAFQFKPGSDTVVTHLDERKHEDLRKKMAAGYSGKENHSLEQSVDNRLQDLVDLIERKYISSDKQSKRLDLARVALFFTLDVISDIAFSRPFGDLTKDEDTYGYIKATAEAMKFMNLLSGAPFLYKIMRSSVLSYFAPSVKDKTGLGPIIGVARDEVRTRYGPDKKENWDMLGSFVRHGLTQEEAEAEAVLQIFAGSDTTGTAIRSTLLYIISTPEVLSQLRREIDTTKPASPISHAEAKQMPYLQAVIREGLRMLPPVISMQDKVCPAEGDVVSGFRVPGGVTVCFNVMAYQRNHVFAPDPDVFRPSRWLTQPPELVADMDRTVDLVFSAGRYQCLGKNVAMMELNKIYVELLRRFDFALVNPMVPWHSRAYALHITRDMWVRVTRRVQS